MENRELREYLAEFADNAPVSIVIANPKKRKVYIPEELFMIRDKKIGQPVLCIQIAEERDMDEDERKAAEEDEKEAEDAVKAARDSEVAYDVNRIVEQLEQLKLDGACNNENCGYCKYFSECLNGDMSDELALDKAIEIVKRGGLDES